MDSASGAKTTAVTVPVSMVMRWGEEVFGAKVKELLVLVTACTVKIRPMALVFMA